MLPYSTSLRGNTGLSLKEGEKDEAFHPPSLPL